MTYPRYRQRSSHGSNGRPIVRPRFRRFRQILAASAGLCGVGILGASTLAWAIYAKLMADLPSIDSLKIYQPPTVSRIYASDDQLMAQLSSERRIFIPIDVIPDRVKKAFLSTEDHNFYNHGGVDMMAILRAGITDIFARHGRRPLGASTITQQVAKVMLLNSNVLTFERKFKEALLAMKIEEVLSKDKILEIYLNGIDLGNGVFGVAAAAQTYFNKTLDQLDDAEAASLAALPKSPTHYNPYLHPKAALARRNLVLDLMVGNGVITPAQAEQDKQEPLLPERRPRFGPLPDSEWFGAEVRRQLIGRYGEAQALNGGLEIHTSMDAELQNAATRILRDGLMHYDHTRGGWRGPVTHLPDVTASNWVAQLDQVVAPAGMLREWRLGILLSGGGRVGWVENGATRVGSVLQSDLAWARRMRSLQTGDVIMVAPQGSGSVVSLKQIPRVEGAAVTMDVRTGRVLALVGGWSFRASQFNRATQALRQPGSSFKPFVYLAAMEQGISPSEKFDDSPVSYGNWHPRNYEHDNWGPTTLHDALRESRNLVTIRVAAHLGMKAVADMAIKAGLVDQMPHVLPAALGAVETTVLREAAAYATIANGGHLVTPSLVDDIQSRTGDVLWHSSALALETVSQPSSPLASPGALSQAPPTADAPDTPSQTSVAEKGITVPSLVDQRPVLASEESSYQIINILKDVIANGTGRGAGDGINRPIAGKTGTSQDFHDAWFAGFSPDLVTVVWVGYDTPTSLGRAADGGHVAGPIWNRIMKVALAKRPRLDFRVPSDIALVRYSTGRGFAVDGFKPEQVPGASVPLQGYGAGTEALTAADTGADAVISSSETDMGSTVGMTTNDDSGVSSGNNASRSSPPVSQPTHAPDPNEGDIGVGGLY